MKKAYLEIMNTVPTMALATCVAQQPNVRVVNFVLSPEDEQCLYFTTFPGSPKLEEMATNAHVAVTTIPIDHESHVRISKATAQPSQRPLAEVAPLFIQKDPGFAETYQQFGNQLLLQEVRFNEAVVTLDLARSEQLIF